MTQIKETMNPFTGASDDNNLYCITTGKAASEVVKQDLLKCKESGQERRERLSVSRTPVGLRNH